MGIAMALLSVSTPLVFFPHTPYKITSQEELETTQNKPLILT